MADQWYAIVDANHQLVSVGTAIAQDASLAQSGYVAIQLSGPPDLDNNVWDPTTHAFVPIQKIDRVQDFIQSSTVWTSLTTTQQMGLQQALVTLLGSRRYRNQDEAVNL